MTAPAPDPVPDDAGPSAGQPPERDEADEIVAARTQLAIGQVSFETGVPTELLSTAETAEDAMRLATDALLWQADSQPAAPPPPATAAVSASEVSSGTGVLGPTERMLSQYQQVRTRDALSRMSPAEVLHHWRSGNLAGLGVSAPNTPAGQTPMTRRPR